MWAWLLPPHFLRAVQCARLEASSCIVVLTGTPSIHSPWAHPSVPQGVQGADFECEGSVVPGKCAFGGPVSELLATMACTQTYAEKCRSAVVYTQGLDGCGSKLVLLKSADPVPSNSFSAPTVFTMERAEGATVGAGRGVVVCGSGPPLPLKESRNLCRAPSGPSLPRRFPSMLLGFTTHKLGLLAAAALQTGGFIFRSEASFLGGISDSDGLPAACNASSNASTAAGGAAPNTTASAGASAANGTAACEPAWLGCMVSNVPALMAGDVVATLDSVPSAEACCRECRKRSPAANVFNYCGRLEGCRWASLCHCCHLASCTSTC